jgi:hypothetical protein
MNFRDLVPRNRAKRDGDSQSLHPVASLHRDVNRLFEEAFRGFGESPFLGSPIEDQGLCEILEERSIGKSTIFTTPLPLDRWSEVIADTVIADAILDRLQHSALTISITGESYRGVKARKLARRKTIRVRIVASAPPVTPSRWYPT